MNRKMQNQKVKNMKHKKKKIVPFLGNGSLVERALEHRGQFLTDLDCIMVKYATEAAFCGMLDRFELMFGTRVTDIKIVEQEGRNPRLIKIQHTQAKYSKMPKRGNRADGFVPPRADSV